MNNVFHLPLHRNPLPRRAAHRRLVAPLNERVALADFAVKRQTYFADPSHDNEVAMLAARDAWNEAYQTAQGAGR